MAKYKQGINDSWFGVHLVTSCTKMTHNHLSSPQHVYECLTSEAVANKLG